MKICVIATVWFPLSHADVIVSRWLKPFPGDEQKGWTSPGSSIASVYLDQKPANDIGTGICAQAGVAIYDTIREALMVGGDRLAVDAVLLIGEHGDYPLNEYGQKLYPRKRFFDEITALFREVGHAVPVFNDKHLSWSLEESASMIATAAELGFPLAAGSSLPHCPIHPENLLLEHEEATEAIALFSGCPEHYGFHIIELALSQLDRRSGCEGRITQVRALEQEATVNAIRSGEIAPDLFKKALVQHGYPDDPGVIPLLLERVNDLFAYQFRYQDGFCLTCLHLPTFVSEWIVAVRTRAGALRSCVAQGGGAADFFSNFAHLNARISEFFATGIAPTPIQRTHLATGALEAALQARQQPDRWIATPHLANLFPF